MPLKIRSPLANGAALAAVAPGVDEGILPVNADDLAVVGAFAAGNFPGDKFHIRYIKGEWLCLAAFPCQYGDAEGAHEMALLVHDHWHGKLLLKHFYNAGIFADTALKNHRGSDLFAFGDII